MSWFLSFAWGCHFSSNYLTLPSPAYWVWGAAFLWFYLVFPEGLVMLRSAHVFFFTFYIVFGEMSIQILYPLKKGCVACLLLALWEPLYMLCWSLIRSVTCRCSLPPVGSLLAFLAVLFAVCVIYFGMVQFIYFYFSCLCFAVLTKKSLPSQASQMFAFFSERLIFRSVKHWG